MSVFVWVLRTLLICAHAFWLGGFTFYSAVVLWILHDELGGHDAGLITGRVTDWLNAVGVVAVVFWWVAAWVERREPPKLARSVRFAAILATTVLLIFQIIDHRILDARLESHGLNGFYAHHRLYMTAATIQWGVNLLLIPLTVRLWADGRPRESRDLSGRDVASGGRAGPPRE